MNREDSGGLARNLPIQSIAITLKSKLLRLSCVGGYSEYIRERVA